MLPKEREERDIAEEKTTEVPKELALENRKERGDEKRSKEERISKEDAAKKNLHRETQVKVSGFSGEKGKERLKKGWKEGGGRVLSLPGEGISHSGTAATDPLQSSPTGLFSKTVEYLGMGQATATKSEGSEREGLSRKGKIYSWLEETADVLLDRLCTTMPTGRLFPLPSSPNLLAKLFPDCPQLVRSMLKSLLCSLNSLNGEGFSSMETASDFQVKVMKGLFEDCLRVSRWDVDDTELSWDEFLRVRGVDYKGDEILTAQTMRWENVSPALPKEVGGVNLEDVVELGCKHYVLNFDEYLLEPEDQKAVRPPKVMVPPEDWHPFCKNLLDLGVFEKIHESELYEVQGQPLLNGLFGVSKNEFSGPHEVMRIIMNLIPLNGVCRGFDGDISTLPE